MIEKWSVIKISGEEEDIFGQNSGMALQFYENVSDTTNMPVTFCHDLLVTPRVCDCFLEAKYPSRRNSRRICKVNEGPAAAALIDPVSIIALGSWEIIALLCFLTFVSTSWSSGPQQGRKGQVQPWQSDGPWCRLGAQGGTDRPPPLSLSQQRFGRRPAELRQCGQH